MARVAQKLVASQARRHHSRQLSKCAQQNVSADDAVSRLGSLTPDLLKSVTVILIKEPGRILALSRDIARELGFGEAPSA